MSPQNVTINLNFVANTNVLANINNRLDVVSNRVNNVSNNFTRVSNSVRNVTTNVNHLGEKLRTYEASQMGYITFLRVLANSVWVLSA